MKAALALLAIAALAAMAWKENQTAGQLRSENAQLATLRTEADRLRADLATATNAPAATGDIARLTEENRDLLKLRNEVRQLRENKAEYDRLAAQNAGSQSAKTALAENASAMKPLFYSADTLRDVGFQSPPDALQTLFFALKQRDPDAFLKCFSGELTPAQKRDCTQLFQGVASEMIANFRGFQIESMRGPQSGRCLLTVTMVESGTTPSHTDDMLLTNTPEGWKMFPGNP